MKYYFKMGKILGKHMVWFIVGAAALGICFPEIFGPLKKYSPWMMCFLTLNNSMNGSFRDMIKCFSRPLPTLVILLLLHLVMPFFIKNSAGLVFSDQEAFITGVIIAYSIPSAVSSLMWVEMAGGNVMLSLSLVLADTLIAPLVIPATILLFTGTSVELDLPSLMKDLMIMTAIPASISMLANQLTGNMPKTAVKPYTDPLAKLFMPMIILGNASGCASYFRNPSFILIKVAVFLVCVNISCYIAGFIFSRILRFDYRTTACVSINTGMRNNAIGNVIATGYFGSEAVFVCSLGPVLSQVTVSFMVKVIRYLGKKLYPDSEISDISV